MPKEPLLFCAIGGMSCKARGLCVFWFKIGEREYVFGFDKVFDCVSLCGRKLFRAARNCIFRENVLY